MIPKNSKRNFKLNFEPNTHSEILNSPGIYVPSGDSIRPQFGNSLTTFASITTTQKTKHKITALAFITIYFEIISVDANQLVLLLNRCVIYIQSGFASNKNDSENREATVHLWSMIKTIPGAFMSL